ncbi:MAG: SMI1/KNR4 family protein [Chloroflexi bacterium]|nr:SMI1/KNR4 family protein [Chloroflexota bacterium]
MALPPSYRAFLRTSNGWRWPGTLVPRLWSAEELEWFRLTDRETIEIWSGPDARPELGELLRRALRISDREIAGTAVYLLVPEPTASDGECEAWLFAHWVPREVRYRSFRELMEAERRSFAEQEAHTAKGMRPSDTPAQLPRKLLNLIGELEAKVRTYRYIGELNSMPDLTAAETAAALQEVADSLRELQNEDLTPDRLLTALGELRERTELEHLSIHQRWIERRSTLDLLHLAHAAREMSRGEGLRQAAALIGWFIGEAD